MSSSKSNDSPTGSLFKSYLEPERSYSRRIIVASVAAAIILAAIAASLVIFPLVVIRELPPPQTTIGVFEAAPPPPPPPPPPAGAEKPKEEKPKVEKPKEKVLTEVKKVPKETKKETAAPSGVQGGVEGGVQGGVVGGVVGGTVGSEGPGKLIAQPQKRLSGQDPEYPANARAKGLSATVVARVCISSVGAVTSIKILKGESEFNENVEKAVKEWRYQPYAAAGVAVSACFPVIFNFNLRK